MLKLRFLKNFDWILFAAIFLLLAMGISVLYSTTLNMVGGSGEALKQLIYAGIGLVLFFLVSSLDYRLLKGYTSFMYIFVLVMLAFLLFYGKTAMGATRWFDFGFFQLQPSEIAKLMMIIIMAKYFAANHEYMNKFKHIVRSFIFMFIPLVLVAMQPDLGTAIVFIMIWIFMVFVSNIKKLYVAFMGVLGLGSLPVIWTFLADYQKQRVLTFINPSVDPKGTGWNISQALIAIGSGRFFGRGLGHGPQSQLNFIPEKHTDFIFAAMAEELGFLGIMVFLGLFLVIIIRGIRAAVNSKDLFGMYLATGIVAMILFHVFVNVGMNIGIMPVTGIPLPLTSYGGTSIIITLVSVGILESIIMRYKKIDF